VAGFSQIFYLVNLWDASGTKRSIYSGVLAVKVTDLYE